MMKTAIYCRLSEEDRNKQCETDDSNSMPGIRNMCELCFHIAAVQSMKRLSKAGTFLLLHYIYSALAYFLLR